MENLCVFCFSSSKGSINIFDEKLSKLPLFQIHPVANSELSIHNEKIMNDVLLDYLSKPEKIIGVNVS